MAHNFKQLKIWQRSMELTDLTYTYTAGLPKDERFNLISQMNRCSCSVPSNIAEGSGKRTDKHFSEFLSTALGSVFELETQVLICEKRKYGDEKIREKILQEIPEIQRMIFTFRETLN